MKILAIGPGESTQWLFKNHQIDLSSNIKLLGMHRVFPYINVNLNYWTWGDPDAALEGLKYYESGDLDTLPKIILPSYFENISLFNQNAGTSSINRRPKDVSYYNSIVEYLKEKNKIIFLPHSKNTRTLSPEHEIFLNPKRRFENKKNYFGTVPFDGRHSESEWAQENKFTSLILPMCHYMEAVEVYCIGFDNRGTGIKRTIPQSQNNPNTIKECLSKYPKWTKEWVGYHNMKIYSIAPDNFTPNNTVMEYKSVKELEWIK